MGLASNQFILRSNKIAQIPKGRLLKGPYKPICSDCALYCSFTVLSYCELHVYTVSGVINQIGSLLMIRPRNVHISILIFSLLFQIFKEVDIM